MELSLQDARCIVTYMSNKHVLVLAGRRTSWCCDAVIEGLAIANAHCFIRKNGLQCTNQVPGT
jgi:hypothetical protein